MKRRDRQTERERLIQKQRQTVRWRQAEREIDCDARLTRPQGLLIWRSPLITFPRISLLLILTTDLHRTIEQARAAHPIPSSKVKGRFAKLVLR